MDKLQNQHFANLAKKKLNSWSSLVLWAGTVTDKTATDLLPRFSSLQMPPVAVKNYVEALVASLKADVGPLPVTEDSLKRQAELYLPWLYHMLTDYEAAAAAGLEHPRMYTILPQISNSLSFITISSSALHGLKFPTSLPSAPKETKGRRGSPKMLTSGGVSALEHLPFATPFKRSLPTECRLMATLHLSQPGAPSASLCQLPQADPPKRKRGTSDVTDSANDPNKQWVRGIDADAIRQAASSNNPQQEGYLVALDPGRRSIFTAVVHDPNGDSQQHLQDPQPDPLDNYFSLSWSNKRPVAAMRARQRANTGYKRLQLFRQPCLAPPLPRQHPYKPSGNTSSTVYSMQMAVLSHFLTFPLTMPPQAEAEEEDAVPESAAGSVQHHQPGQLQHNCGIR
ncbi:hypothetical protein ABBQ38_013390 [Trebouxia sp. C0009 RCD-2024]